MTGRIELVFDNYIVVAIESREKALQTADKFQGKELEITIKDATEKKRSKRANAYAWALLSQIAEEMSIPREEVYRNMIRDVGVSQLMEINKEAYKTFCYSWELMGNGFQVEELDEHDGMVQFLAYYGTSTYNTKQMSRFLDAVVQEAKSLGIETESDAELALLKEEWP